jgi:hypothetical protein
MKRLRVFAGRPGTRTSTRQADFVTPAEHKLRDDLWLAKGLAKDSSKIQATQGASLEDLPTLMKYFGSNVPNETNQERGERSGARELLYGTGKESAGGKDANASDLLGAAPMLGALALDHAKRNALKESDFAGDTSAAHGFFSLVLMYVKLLTVAETRQAKYLVPLLSRTSFATMFKMLPAEQRRALRANNASLLVNAVLAAANANQMMRFERFVKEGNSGKQEQYFTDVNFRDDESLVRSKDLRLTALTIGHWLRSLSAANGSVDLLNGESIKQLFVAENDKRAASRSLESFAVVGDDPNPSKKTNKADVPGHTELAIFENRFIGGSWTAEEAHVAARNYLQFFINLKEGKGAPGAYPK